MRFPDPHPDWQGETCCMCEGAGEYLHALTEPRGAFLRHVGYVATGMRCPACNGHGKDPS